jgi:hypothetical protein
MDNSVKKYLTKVIKESIYTDVDEMAVERKKTRDDSGKLSKFKHHWEREFEGDVKPQFNDNNTSKDVPDYWIINPTLTHGEEKIIIQTGCEEAQAFIEKNQEWISQLEQRHHIDQINVVNCRRTAFKPRNLQVGTPWQGAQKSSTASEKNQRKLNEILYKTMFYEGSEFSKILNKLSIPTIVINKDELKQNAQAIDLRKNKDNHEGTYENDKILYRSHINNSYSTAVDFLNAVLDRNEGVEPENVKTYYMPRQYKLKYKGWEPERKMKKDEYQGKTPVRGDDVRAYEEENLDVTVRTDYEILGQREGDSFFWNIRMKVDYAKKLTDESYLKDGFKNMELLQASSTAQLEPGTVFDDENPAMKNFNVVSALEEAIGDLIAQIKGITINEILPYANVDARQAGLEFELHEQVKEKLIKRVVSKIRK